jgi:anaerobic magnesium-protoporphyrin IX monomethyl ester cyclase
MNAKYVHTNLALRYLRASIRPDVAEITLKEFTINESLRRIAGEIFEEKAEVIGFSCYIWNIRQMGELIRLLRPVCPGVRFVLGGPEVSYNAEEWLEKLDVDAIVRGAGEETFRELLSAWRSGGALDSVAGVTWRQGERVRSNPARRAAQSLDQLPLPYEEDEDLNGRLAYLETARGCPFQCQYCLSSAENGLSLSDPEVFRHNYRRLMECGATTVKLVDRTFNAERTRALRILDIAKEEAERYPGKKVRLHCEIAGELLDQAWYDYLAAYPEGLVQLEIGVQSTHPPALQAIQRRQHFTRWAHWVRELRRHTDIHLHLDLIAGLPLEGWPEFRNSFNDVYALTPQRLQLGFLKVLRGSGLYQRREEWGLVYSPDPPYTILQTAWLSYVEIVQLERIEELVERYYNSGRFTLTLHEAVSLRASAFDLFNDLARFWRQRGWFKRAWKSTALYQNIWEYLDTLTCAPAQRARLLAALRADYERCERSGHLPEFLVSTRGISEQHEQKEK